MHLRLGIVGDLDIVTKKEKDFVDSLASLLGYRESELLFRYDSNRDACYLLK